MPMVLQPLVDALRRYLHLVIGPEDEWNLIVAERPSLGEAVLPFTVIGLAVSLVFSLAGALLVAGENSVALAVASRLVVDGATVASFAAASGFMARRVGAVRPAMGEVAALYSSAGLWMSSVLAFVPVPVLGFLWFLMGAVYTGYLYYHALDAAVGVPAHVRIKAFAASMAVLVLVSSVLRAVEFVLVG
ncbi:MAG: hypothetical protein JRG91_00795 [Deltaproteobacteria bacterium]|nr:hypothetical protein [Deltaproteobacteria bacterium]